MIKYGVVTKRTKQLPANRSIVAFLDGNDGRSQRNKTVYISTNDGHSPRNKTVYVSTIEKDKKTGSIVRIYYHENPQNAEIFCVTRDDGKFKFYSPEEREIVKDMLTCTEVIRAYRTIYGEHVAMSSIGWIPESDKEFKEYLHYTIDR